MLSRRSLTEYVLSALVSWDSEGFLMIGIFWSSAHSSQTFTISADRIPGYNFTSSEVFLQIVHIVMKIGRIFIF